MGVFFRLNPISCSAPVRLVHASVRMSLCGCMDGTFAGENICAHVALCGCLCANACVNLFVLARVLSGVFPGVIFPVFVCK